MRRELLDIFESPASPLWEQNVTQFRSVSWSHIVTVGQSLSHVVCQQFSQSLSQ